MTAQDFAAEVNSTLDRHGLTQTDFARLMFVNRRTLGRWVKGEHAPRQLCIQQLRKVQALLESGVAP